MILRIVSRPAGYLLWRAMFGGAVDPDAASLPR